MKKEVFKHTIIRNIINATYFAAVFIASLAIATQALARQSNTYNKLMSPIIFNIKKETIIVSTLVSGSVDEIFVKPGQYVKKGDILVQLKDDGVSQKIEALEKIAKSNISAKTEANVLKSQAEQYTIKAPRDGVVYEIHAGEGSYLNSGVALITLFASDNIHLLSNVSESQYAVIQQEKKLNVFSSRFDQVYGVIFESVRRVGNSEDGYSVNFEVQFRFENPDEGAAFIQGEQVEVVDFDKDNSSKLPSEYIASIWNSLIIGEID